MINFFKRLYKFISKKYNQLVLDSRAYMFYEIISFKKEIKKKHNVNLGNYLEFGVYKGDATIAFYKALKKFQLHNFIKIFLFDSFTGLPEKESFKDNKEIWHKGLFDVGGKNEFEKILKRKGLSSDRVTIIDGFFEKSLENLNLDLNPGIINIDCDYYSSAVTVLNFLSDKMPAGTLIYFDDLNSFFNSPNKGVLSAVNEFNEKHSNIGLCLCPQFSGKYQNRIYWVWKDN